MRLTLAILAAGSSSRFGRPKQLQPVGPAGEALFEYAVHDAIEAGCDRVIFVTAPDAQEAFRATVKIRIGTSIPVEFASQSVEDVPTGFRAPAARVKPWGTGHAVYTLRSTVREPFIVANADDFYGAGSIRSLVRCIRDGLTTGDPSHYLAGYELGDTGLAEEAGVSRAICSHDASLVLEGLVEVREVRSTPAGPVGARPDGSEIALRPERLCSMNLWAFRPSIFEHVGGAWQRFHARLRDPMEDEFLLSDTVGGLVETGRIRVRVVPMGARAFGLTHPGDVGSVESGINQSVASGDYPTDLGRWFEARCS